jgi:hypothetical protein
MLFLTAPISSMGCVFVFMQQMSDGWGGALELV